MTRTIVMCLCVALLGSCANTRWPGKPPGWRPDQPKEGGGDVVDRIARRLERYKKTYGVVAGSFLDDFERHMRAQQQVNDDLRPATLMPEGMTVKLSEPLRASMRAEIRALEWQQKQMDALEKLELSQAQSDVARWAPAAIDTYLVDCSVVDEVQLRKLPRDKRVSLAKDLATLHRIFMWTFDNMPDDEEAKEISARMNADAGYPPPSPLPPPPPPPPPAAPPPVMRNALGAPPPPPPALVAGLRSLLSGIDGCRAACMERAEDWFEQANKWGATSVVSMVRLELTESFLKALALSPETTSLVKQRLGRISTTVAATHDEL